MYARLQIAGAAARYVALTVGTAMLLLALAEALLHVTDYGAPTRLFVVDGAAAPPVWRDNPQFARRFFSGAWLPETAPSSCPVDPPGNALRVAVLGESAAYGYPDPAFALSRFLEGMLERQYPERKVEVINAALSGVSATVLQEALRDVLQLAPDVVVLYTGNNEFIGPFGAGMPGQVALAPWWRVRAQMLASRLRLVQLLRPHGVRPLGQADGPMASQSIAPADPRVGQSEARYEKALRAMIDLAGAAKVPVILCTVAVNERDWAPFGSARRAGLTDSALNAWQQAWREGEAAWIAGDAAQALAAWQRAEALDATPAVLHFAMARALTELGRCTEAEALYTRACAQDALRYRVTSAMNARVRAVAADYPAGMVHFAECAGALQDSCEAEAPPLFYDHCHLTPEGNYRVAMAVRSAMDAVLPPPAAGVPALEEILARLGWSPWHALENLRYVAHQAIKPPYPNRFEHDAWREEQADAMEALLPQTTSIALREGYGSIDATSTAHPDDIYLARNRAQLRMAAGDHAEAAIMSGALVAQAPRFAAGWTLLAAAETAAGRPAEAATAWRAACQLRPERRDWARALAEALGAAAQYAEARVVWRSLVEQDRADFNGWWRLAQTHELEGDLAAAIAVYREACVAAPDQAGLHYYLAKALAAHGQQHEAREAAAHGLRLAPENAGLKLLVESLAP